MFMVWRFGCAACYLVGTNTFCMRNSITFYAIIFNVYIEWMRSALQDANTFLRIPGAARLHAWLLSRIQWSAIRPKPSRISIAIAVTSDDDVFVCGWCVANKIWFVFRMEALSFHKNCDVSPKHFYDNSEFIRQIINAWTITNKLIFRLPNKWTAPACNAELSGSPLDELLLLRWSVVGLTLPPPCNQ